MTSSDACNRRDIQDEPHFVADNKQDEFFFGESPSPAGTLFCDMSEDSLEELRHPGLDDQDTSAQLQESGRGAATNELLEVEEEEQITPIPHAQQQIAPNPAQQQIAPTPIVQQQTAARLRRVRKKEDPLDTVVRNRHDNGWEATDRLFDGTAALLTRANRQLATGPKKNEYAVLVCVKDTSEFSCIQCQVIMRNKKACGLKGANTACNQCVKAGRPCSMLIDYNGSLTAAFLPLPAREREPGSVWEIRGYWKM